VLCQERLHEHPAHEDPDPVPPRLAERAARLQTYLLLRVLLLLAQPRLPPSIILAPRVGVRQDVVGVARGVEGRRRAAVTIFVGVAELGRRAVGLLERRRVRRRLRADAAVELVPFELVQDALDGLLLLGLAGPAEPLRQRGCLCGEEEEAYGATWSSSRHHRLLRQRLTAVQCLAVPVARLRQMQQPSSMESSRRQTSPTRSTTMNAPSYKLAKPSC
ncbi:unnamed protein product, partial [Pelagomonas calceolata]